MFDNLRDQANSTPLYEEQAKFQPEAEATADTPSRRSGRLLGMTARQRFLIAVLLLFAVCSLGAMCLMVTEKIGLP